MPQRAAITAGPVALGSAGASMPVLCAPHGSTQEGWVQMVDPYLRNTFPIFRYGQSGIFHNTSTVCRGADPTDPCDRPEYCGGNSSQCTSLLAWETMHVKTPCPSLHGDGHLRTNQTMACWNRPTPRSQLKGALECGAAACYPRPLRTSFFPLQPYAPRGTSKRGCSAHSKEVVPVAMLAHSPPPGHNLARFTSARISSQRRS